MRYFSAVLLFSLLISIPCTTLAQAAPSGNAPGLIITNYQFVNSVRISSTQSDLTYRADLVNPGTALATMTATLRSLDPATIRIVQGQDTLNFTPVPAHGQVTSNNTFTILVDNSTPLDFGKLQWIFQGPIADAGPNQTVTPASTVTLNGSGSTNSSGIGTLAYSWAFTSVPAASAAVLKNPTSALPSFVVDVPGDYVITLTVDNGAASSTASVTVSTSNTSPVANAGANQTVQQNSSVVLNGSGSSDVDGNPLTYRWTLIARPAGSAATLAGANTVSPMFVADQPGTYVAQLIVNDGQADSNPVSVTVTTHDPPPVADAGSSQIVSAGALVQLNGSGSTDVDGELLTYTWNLISVPSGSMAALSDPTSLMPTFTADVPGTYIAQLIVSNGTFASQPATVTITSNATLPPVANAGLNQHVSSNNAVTLNGSGADPQGLPLKYQWALIVKPSGSTAQLSNAGTQNPAFFADMAGTYVAQLIVNNGHVNSGPSTVTVSTTDTPPVADAGANQNVIVGANVKLDGSRSLDADGDALKFSWAFLLRPSGSAATLAGANTGEASFNADLPGYYVVQLIVSDSTGNSNPATVMITAVRTPAITINPAPLALSTDTPGTLSVLLSAPAGTGGQTVNVTSSNTKIATVPASLTVPQGSTGANITVGAGASGAANITASASGFASGSATVNVTVPATIALDSANVGANRTINGKITLSAAAGAGGAVFQLSSTPNGIVMAHPASVTIAAGATSGTFTVTGLMAGSATIAASSPGYSSNPVNVSVVNLGTIILPASMTVALGKSAAFSVSLPSPAPAGGVTVTLGSSDSSIVTLSATTVVIPAGQTTAATEPQVNGVSLGSATISAAATGYSSPAQPTIRVTTTMSFSPQTLTINGNATKNLTLNLSAPAPAPGLTINLSSDNPSVATVPATVAFDGHATSVTVPVSGVGLGSTVIHASASNIPDTTAKVTVANSGSISLLSGGTVVLGQTAPLSVILSAPAPGPVTILLTSTDPTKVTVSPTSVFIAGGSQIPSTVAQVTGVSIGTATILATAPGYTPAAQSFKAVVTANFVPASATFKLPGSVSLTLNIAPPAPASGLTANLTSSDPTVATVPATVSFAPNASSVIVPVTGVKAGAVVIHASAPPNIPNTTATVIVLNTDGTPAAGSGGGGGSSGGSGEVSGGTGGGVVVTSASVGQSLETEVTVTLPQTAPVAGQKVTLKSSDPTKLLVAGNASSSGTGSLVITMAGVAQTGFFVQGLASSGTVTLTASLDDGTSGTATITLTPSAFILVGPNGIGSSSFNTNQGLNTTLDIFSVRLDASSAFAEVQQVRGGASASVDVASVNTTVGTITSSPLVFHGGDQDIQTAFAAASSGSTSVTASVPTGFSTPSGGLNSITATVSPAGIVTPPSISVGNNLEADVNIALNGGNPSGVDVTITSNNPSLLLLSKHATDPGSASITISLNPNNVATDFFVQGLAASGSGSYTISAPGYGSALGKVTLAPSGILLGTPSRMLSLGTSFVTSISFIGPSQVPVYPAMLNASGNPVDTSQPIAGGHAFNVNVTSTSPAVGSVAPSTVTLAGGSSEASFTFDPLSPGTTTLQWTQPAGFTTPVESFSIDVRK